MPFPWSAMGDWPVAGVVSVAGPPGAGKSTLGALLQPVAWLTCEQTPAQAAALLARCKADPLPEIVAFTRGDHQTVLDELAGIAEGLVVLDSLTASGGVDEQLELLGHIIRWAQAGGDRRALVVLGVNSDDQAAGRRQVRHAVDACVYVQLNEDGNRSFELEKNRFGPVTSSYFRINGHGASKPRFPYSYTVEGKAGAYRLVPYPTEGAKWDGLFRAAFGKAPEPGWASAARWVPTYPDGRLEPADVDERKRFAEAHGLKWFTRAPPAPSEDDDDG